MKETETIRHHNEGETLEELFGSRLRVIQPAKGYRFSVDAILLASFFRERPESHILEIGPGCGIISLILATRNQSIRITGIEIQDDLAELARRNAVLNGLQNRIAVETGDIRRIVPHFPPAAFDAVLFNPPYRRIASGKINPNRQKAVARHEIKGSFAEFLHSARRALKAGGSAVFIYPAPRTVEAVSTMRREKIEPKRMRMVHSYPDTEARFILMEGVKDGGEELRILPPLHIYKEGKTYTPEMQNILRSFRYGDPDSGTESPD